MSSSNVQGILGTGMTWVAQEGVRRLAPYAITAAGIGALSYAP